MFKLKTLRLVIFSLFFWTNGGLWSDQIKKKYANDNYLVFFDHYAPKSGDVLTAMDSNGGVAGTLVVKIAKGNRAFALATSGKEKIHVGLMVRAGGATHHAFNNTTDKNIRSWFVGLNLGYTLPGFTYMVNTIDYGLEVGKRLSPRFTGLLDLNSFSTSGYRFALLSGNLQFSPLSRVPVFISGGIGVSIVSAPGVTLTDPLFSFSLGYEAAITKRLSIIPKLWGAYVYGIDALVSYEMFQLGIACRYYF
jgi:hypothetical protein